MPASAVTLSALRDLAAATPLSEAEITGAVEQGVATAYRRLVEDDSTVRARVNLESEPSSCIASSTTAPR
jgi:hypothetical protein